MVEKQGNNNAARYMAPELHDPDTAVVDHPLKLRQTADVFSFSCVCLEVGDSFAICCNRSSPALQLYTLKPPFPHIRYDAMAIQRFISGERPPRPSDEECPSGPPSEKLWCVISEGWTVSPRDRPKIRDILYRLTKTK
jgi:hypothetical protein